MIVAIAAPTSAREAFNVLAVGNTRPIEPVSRSIVVLPSRTVVNKISAAASASVPLCCQEFNAEVSKSAAFVTEVTPPTANLVALFNNCIDSATPMKPAEIISYFAFPMSSSAFPVTLAKSLISRDILRIAFSVTPISKVEISRSRLSKSVAILADAIPIAPNAKIAALLNFIADF